MVDVTIERTSTHVWAVIPVFRPDEELVSAVRAHRQQVEEVVVVDDGSGPAFEELFDRLAAAGASVERQSTNAGIGAALNRGIDLALHGGASHVLFLDQDSRPHPGFVEALLDEQRKAAKAGIAVGSSAPEFFSELRQAAERADGFLEARRAIQSGMLVPREIFERVGRMRQEWFIDLVDVEFELRVRRAGYLPIAAPGLRLDHRLGRRYRRRRFPLWMGWLTLAPEVTLSTPFRYYYRLRNRLLLNRDYFWTMPAVHAKETVADLLHFVDTVALSSSPRTMVAIYLRALRDGIRGRTGPMPDGLAARAARLHWRADALDQS